MLPLHVPRSMPRHVLRYYYGLYIRAAAGRSGRDRVGLRHLTFYLNVRSTARPSLGLRSAHAAGFITPLYRSSYLVFTDVIN